MGDTKLWMILKLPCQNLGQAWVLFGYQKQKMITLLCIAVSAVEAPKWMAAWKEL